MLEIKDEKVLKVVADPLRRRVLLHLSQPRSIREVASALGETQQKLNYHFRLLETHRLISSCGSRTVGRNIERLFKANGPFRIAPSLAVDAGYGVNLGVQTVLEESSRQYAAGYEAAGDGPYEPVFHLAVGRLGTAALARVKNLVDQLVAEATGSESRAGQWYGLTVVLHPIAGPVPAASSGDET